MASAQNLLGHLFLEFSLVACRLPSLTLRCALLEATSLRRGLFLKPAGASLFRMRSPSSFLAAVSHGLGTILLSF